MLSPTCPKSIQGSILARSSSSTKCRRREESPTTSWYGHAVLLIFPSPPHLILRFSHSICHTGPAHEIQKNSLRKMPAPPYSRTEANHAPAPNRRPRFPLGTLVRFD